MRTNIRDLAVVVCFLFLLCGCGQRAQPVADPFLGRTTVPPPGTGQAGQVVPPNPYDASAPAFAPPAVGAPPASYAPPMGPTGVPPTTYAPTTTPGYQPPPVTGSAYHQSRWRASSPLSAVEGNASEPAVGSDTPQGDESTTAHNAANPDDQNMARADDAQATPVTTASFRDPRGYRQLATADVGATEQLVTANAAGAVEPYDLDAAMNGERRFAWTDSEPARTAPANGTVVNDVPRADIAAGEVNERQFTQQWQAEVPKPQDAQSGGAGQLAGWKSPVTGARAGNTPVQFTSMSEYAAPVTRTTGSAEYSHDREYTRLSGVLEHSRVSGEWKLRYIPIDGETDSYGGSVRLKVDGVEGYQHGEAVTVEGQIESDPAGGKGYAPTFRATTILRQAT